MVGKKIYHMIGTLMDNSKHLRMTKISTLTRMVILIEANIFECTYLMVKDSRI